MTLLGSSSSAFSATDWSDSDPPQFEGQHVDLTRAKLTRVSQLDVDVVARIDDVVRLYVEGTVTRVDHVVDPRTGKLQRHHTISVTEAVALPPVAPDSSRGIAEGMTP